MRTLSVVPVLVVLVVAIIFGKVNADNVLADDEEIVNATRTIIDSISTANVAMEPLKNEPPSTDYMKLGTQGLLEYVSNLTAKFTPVFKDFEQNDLEVVQQSLIEAIRYLNGYDVVNSISLLQNVDYNLFNHNQFRSINNDLRIASIALSEALFNQRDTIPSLDDLLATTDKLVENVVRLSDTIQKGEAWTLETTSRAMAAQRGFNESIDNYLNASATRIEDTTEALSNLRTYEEELYQKMKDKIPLFPKSTVNYFIALKKSLENLIQKVLINFENMRLYKHRDIEQWKIRSSISAPIAYMTQIAVQVSADPMLANDCTEAYIEKLLAFPNFTMTHVNGCLREQMSNEENTFDTISNVIDNYVVSAINASYTAFDICFQYAPKKLSYCLDLNGYENTWANARILTASRQIESFIDSEIQNNFNTCIAQIGYFLNYHNLQEMCFYNKKRNRPRGRW
ncbi:uncharacterized protein LOC131678282 [Topomyia yanbarensis]|uniref:uncharacterized protein LOC131678282 n=1 Tax=Topomyia yanbarensis TaxID=2498891 RepID=UPI00273C53EA|nr:uncharacterized protein LOC131678282 [Topomyia yanbarensis]